MELLSKGVRSIAGGADSTDVTLVCEDGHKVHTHIGLLAALSKKMGEIFASLNVFPEVVFIPDMKREVVEKLLDLYSKRWDEIEVDLDLWKAAYLLGLPLPRTLTRKHIDSNNFSTTQEPKTQTKDSKTGKPTMPSVLVRVKKEMMERDEANPNNDENDDSESSDDENEPPTEPAFEGTEEEEKSTDATEQGLKCGQCGAAFEDKDELTIHIGEVFMGEYHHNFHHYISIILNLNITGHRCT